MYRLPRDNFPVRAIHCLRSAPTGWQATVFYRTPSAREKLDMDGGLPQGPLYREWGVCQIKSESAGRRNLCVGKPRHSWIMRSAAAAGLFLLPLCSSLFRIFQKKLLQKEVFLFCYVGLRTARFHGLYQHSQ